MIERLKYWLFQKGKGCHHCCIWCEYFDICRWDVMTGKTAEQEDRRAAGSRGSKKGRKHRVAVSNLQVCGV